MKRGAFSLILLGLFFLLPLHLSLVSALAGPSCQQIGTPQEGWYENEQLVINANCSGCESVCASTGTQQEGWHSSCDKSLIKYEACYVKCDRDSNCPVKYTIYCKDLRSCSEKISYKCENPGTTVSNCVVSSPSVSCIDCLYGCSDGSCKSQEIPVPQTICIDSDGEDYYTRGYVKTQNGEIWDSCAGTELREGICLEGRYDKISYACLQGCNDGKCIKQETWAGLVHIEIVESICEACTSTTKETQTLCRCDSTKLYNAKIQLYDSSGNLIGSGDTSNGYAEFSGLKEGRYTASLYAEGYSPDKAEINLGQNIGNYYAITLKKAGAATGNIKIAVQDKITGSILTNSKVLVYDSYGNFITSADTSAGAAVFYSLKAGAYIAIASASEYNQNKAEFKIIGGESDYLTVGLEQIQTTQPTITTTPAIYWYRNAYWQCYDGYEEKSGGESSCKPPEVWGNYAKEACKNHCYADKSKCGVNSFSIYNECPGSSNVQPSACGNGICESGEGERCEIKAIACEVRKKCEAQSTQSAKCYYGCEQDCKQTEEKSVNVKLNDKFKLQMSQEARFEDLPLEIKFNDFFLTTCIENAVSTSTQKSVNAVVEKYNPVTGAVIDTIAEIPTSSSGGGGGGSTGGVTTTSAGGGAASPSVASTSCKEAEPYAVLQIKLIEEKNQKTEVIKLKMGEKKKVFDFTISFLDNDIQGKTGLFLVSREAFECPINCICDLAGNITECKKIEACEKGTMLCQDGVCRKKCGIENITTECKFGCFYNEKCLPYGLRVNKLYCSIDDNMKSQLAEEESCENNFECSTNVCVNGKCISAGLIQMIIDWFKKLFGG